MSDTSKTKIYERAGVEDVAEFYRTKFVSDEILDARYFTPLSRFDIRFARTMWVYDNVRAGASVLDLGCGAGMLALLKRKGITLAGVDISAECVTAALSNGYDAVCRSALTHLPFPDNSFNYVVSLDVLGHVAFEEKDSVLREIRRVLRPDGVTMHGIECTDSQARKDYSEMAAEELRRFIEVDGHVGLEEEDEHAARFRRFFKHVAWEPRYVLCLSSEEFLKQADKYGLPFEEDFLEYLRGLSFKERRAFDMATGYIFNKISDLNLRLPKSGLYVFVKASDAPLGSFYNEHRDRRMLFQSPYQATSPTESASQLCLDRSPVATFDDGWYDANMLPPVARWMGTRGRIHFQTPSISMISLDLTTHMPELSSKRPLHIEVLLNGKRLSAFCLFRYGWLELNFELPEPLVATKLDAVETPFELELRADRTWKPRPNDPENRDDRNLSIAVCNIEIYY